MGKSKQRYDMLSWAFRLEGRSLWSENANHLKTGAAPPKHGHIFMHPWISRSPRWVRGKIARTIAAKASIAAKVDAFEGEPWTKAMVEQIDQKIEEIKTANPKPKRRSR